MQQDCKIHRAQNDVLFKSVDNDCIILQVRDFALIKYPYLSRIGSKYMAKEILKVV